MTSSPLKFFSFPLLLVCLPVQVQVQVLRHHFGHRPTLLLPPIPPAASAVPGAAAAPEPPELGRDGGGGAYGQPTTKRSKEKKNIMA